MSNVARTRNPRGSGERLRDEILSAAIQLIDETSDANALTLRGIARRAGISAPSIYSHFDSLPTLVDAVLQSSFEELLESVAGAMAAQPQPAAKLLAAGHAYVEFAWGHQARYRLMFAESGYADNAIETFALVAGSIQDCVDAGISSSTDPRADTWIIWAALHGVATLDKPSRTDYLRLGPLNRSELLDTIIRRLALIPDSESSPPR